MLKKTLVIVAVAASAVIAGPAAVATAATLSSVSESAATSTTHDADSAMLAPAMWVWGGTGIIGVSGMLAFGVVVSRARRAEASSVAAMMEMKLPQYA